MASDKSAEDSLTTLLHAWREGNGSAFSELIDKVYGQLRTMAANRLRQMQGAATLSPTELLHETLIGIMPGGMAFENRVHFFATMSLAIRSVLVDHARARLAHKRGGDLFRVTLTNADAGEESQAFGMLAVEEALTQLEALDPRAGQALHLTYFAGLGQEEIAALLNTSVATVTRDLRFARGWVTRTLTGEG